MLNITRKTVARFHLEGQGSFLAGDLRTAEFVRETPRAAPQKRDALAPGGIIAIQEFLVEEDRRGPPLPVMFAVNMLVGTEEGDTSFNEIGGWLHDAGFVDSRTVKTPGPSPLILANRPK